MTTRPKDCAERLAAELRAHGADDCVLAIVLGSGLGALAERVIHATVIEASDLEWLPGALVPGHTGRITLGELNGVRVLLQQGRVHLYEGWDVSAVTRAVRAFSRLGVRGVLLTNAAGSLEPSWAPGTFMRITDHLDLQGVAPLGTRGGFHGRVYDERLGLVLEHSAGRAHVVLQSGVYAGLLGPAYETPAEIRMLKRLGARAVGMSTVAEASAARVAGMRVAAVSCLTNYASGISAEPLKHEDVVQMGREVAGPWMDLCENAAAGMAAELTG